MKLKFECNDAENLELRDLIASVTQVKIRSIENKISSTDDLDIIEQKERQIMGLQNELQRFLRDLRAGSSFQFDINLNL